MQIGPSWTQRARYRDLWRIVYEQMHMILLAVELCQFRFEVAARARINRIASHPIQVLFHEQVSPIFRSENKVDVHCEDTMPTVPQFAINLPRPPISPFQ